MRYVIQALVMLGDIAVILVSLWLLYFQFSVLSLVLVAIAITVWHKGGGFMAWQPSIIKQFMANAKKYGL